MRYLSHFLFFAALLAPPLGLSAEPQLAGHWKLDEKSGDSVLDSSAAKNHGRAISQPGRAAALMN